MGIYVFLDRKILEPTELLSVKSQFLEKNLVLLIKKSPSLALPRKAIMLCITFNSLFRLYYLSSGHL